MTQLPVQHTPKKKDLLAIDQLEWETREINDPVTCEAYAKQHDLLAVEGWCRFRKLAKKDKVLARAIQQSKIRQVRRSQTYMFGYLIHRNYMEAMQFDAETNIANHMMPVS